MNPEQGETSGRVTVVVECSLGRLIYDRDIMFLQNNLPNTSEGKERELSHVYAAL